MAYTVIRYLWNSFKKTYRVLCNELFIIQILQYSMLLYITGISFNQKLKADVKIL